MTKTYLILLVLSLFVVAYVPRLFPMLYFTHRKVPSWFSEWMKYVPVALFAALAFKDVFITHEHCLEYQNLSYGSRSWRGV